VSAPLLAARWPHHRPPPGRFAAPPVRGEGRGEGPWRVVVTHRAGSLEAAVARARRRNLALSAAVLLLLAGSLAVMAFAAQRARRLARQQMELVAGVTHDLNTPLAAIRSAAQNLADGVVAAPDQVRRYGTLIEREGSRLSALVAKALELAGIQSGSRVYRPEPVALAEVVGEALDASRWALQEGGFAVEEDVPADLPPVRADRGALQMAVQNLVDNAVKHAAAGRWLGLRARAAGAWVTLTVEDRGPGIRPEDRPHLFEPFFRGPAAAGPVPGSGLGLSLVRQVVEAQGGRVSVAPGAAGRGSAFALRLPVHA
jgi:signal transduction histidine kinase